MAGVKREGQSSDDLSTDVAAAPLVRKIAKIGAKTKDGEIDLKHPEEGKKVPDIGIQDLKKGDNIYVIRFLFSKTNGVKKELGEGVDKRYELWAHHFLVGEVEDTKEEKKWKRRFEVYELTGNLSKRANTRSYWVTAYKENEEDCWIIGDDKPSKEEKDFKGYVKRGLNRYDHEDYAKHDIDEVMRLATSICNADNRGKYHMLHMNCEHFVNFCKGLTKYGYSFQIKTHGKKSFAMKEQGCQLTTDGAEKETQADDCQVTDHDVKPEWMLHCDFVDDDN